MADRPTLLIISATIRRDLHRPFRRFTKFRVIHAYLDAAYGDLDEGDLGPDTRQYRSIAELTALIQEVQPDLIQGPEPVASRLMLRVAWLVWQHHRQTGTPYFFPNFENLPLAHKFGPIVGFAMGQFFRRYARDAAWLFVLNEGARRTLTSLGVPAEKIIRANWGNWGIDRTEFRPAADPPKRRVPHPVIVFVGRLSAAKGVDTLLDAFERIRSTVPNAELWLVGPSKLDAGNAPLIERARRAAGVKLMGSKKQRELPAIMRQAWVNVLLSRTTKRWAEQVGMTNLQALACGTPVVTTDSGSIAEYLEGEGAPHVAHRTSNIQQSVHGSRFTVHDTGHGALLVPENDSTTAATTILTILQDPERRERMGEAGVAWIRNSFDEATNVPALEQLILDRFTQERRDH